MITYKLDVFTGFLIKKNSELELDCVGEHIALDKCLEDTLEYAIKVEVLFQFNFISKHTAPSVEPASSFDPSNKALCQCSSNCLKSQPLQTPRQSMEPAMRNCWMGASTQSKSITQRKVTKEKYTSFVLASLSNNL